MTGAAERVASEIADRGPGEAGEPEAAPHVVFRCEYCLELIDDGSPVFMCRDASYCSSECRRRGRSLRRAQLESMGDMRRQVSSSNASTWSTMVSDLETCSGSSAPSSQAPPAPMGRGILGWILGEGLRKLASMVKAGELVRAASMESLATPQDARLGGASLRGRSRLDSADRLDSVERLLGRRCPDSDELERCHSAELASMSEGALETQWPPGYSGGRACF
jgi:hypothetical protein